MRKSALVYLASALFSFSSFASSSIPQYQMQATELKLWEHPFWNKLLHYEKESFGGYESQVDARTYFLSPKGKFDPQEELLTDIAALFDSEKQYPNVNDHPACKFPLRYRWFKEKLKIESHPNDQLNCSDFNIWKGTLGVSGISLIFASSYTNNPASAFGHTFLRLQRVQNNIEMPDMLHYTVNFAAETGAEKGLLYTVKGLFGAYPGYFSNFPYYIKIQQYNNFESRDIWEYKLNLSAAQIDTVVLHLWEMGSAFFNYYFGDENCSYFLLSLLEITDDETNFRKHLPFFTIPIDTLKIVKKESAWIQGTAFRPSLRRRYKAAFETFDQKEKKVFNDVVKDKSTETLKTISPLSQAKVLDASVDFISMKEKQNAKTDFQKKILDIRSEIDAPYEKPEIIQPGDPLTSHPTQRLGLGGSRIAGRNFVHLDFRGVYHDLLDNISGFDPGAQIQSMEGRVRVSTDNGKVSLDHLKLIEVLSLNPVEKYLSKPSWNVGFGWRKNYSNTCFDCGALYVEGGPGFTLGKSEPKRIYFTLFTNGFLQAGPWNATDYQIGPSGTSMFLLDVTKKVRFQLSGNARYSPIGEPNFIYKGTFEGALEFSKTVSLRGWANQYRGAREYGASLYCYF